MLLPLVFSALIILEILFCSQLLQGFPQKLLFIQHRSCIPNPCLILGLLLYLDAENAITREFSRLHMYFYVVVRRRVGGGVPAGGFDVLREAADCAGAAEGDAKERHQITQLSR